MVDYLIRRVNIYDATALMHLWRDLVEYHQTLSADLPGIAPNGAARYAKRIVQHLDDPQKCALVAEVEGKVVGFALAYITDIAPDVFERDLAGLIADLYVQPVHRRLGIGAGLVEHLKAWFSDHAVTYYDWDMAAANREGQAFWQALGGRPVMLRMRAEVADEDTNRQVAKNPKGIMRG